MQRYGSRLALGVAAVCAVLCVAGCKTPPEDAPQLEEVHPLALLSGDSSIYVGVPVRYHRQLVADILCAELPSISTNDARTVVSQIDTLYAGLATVSDRSRLELSASGSIPQAAQKLLLTPKNGWNPQVYKARSTQEALAQNYPSTFDYYLRTDTAFQVGLPSRNILTVAKNLAPLLEQYAVRPQPAGTDYNSWVDIATNGGEDIRFYITRPGQYLRSLIGSDILGSNDVYGTLAYVPDAKNPSAYSGNYNLTFDVTFSSSRAARTVFAALQLSLGLMGGDIRMAGDNVLEVTGIEVTEKRLIDLFTRDPITGKHFEVTE